MKQIVYTFWILFILPNILFAQERNKIDELGRKQGVFVEQSGGWFFESTYKDDVLHGFTRRYLPDGITLMTGYYKNDRQDSLWTEYYNDTTINYQEYYKDGYKNGETIIYFENGNVKERKTYKKDKLVGDQSYYFEDGSTKFSGNQENGIWLAYHENGNLKSKQEFLDGNLSGERYYFSERGDTILPRQINPRLVENDSSIINETDLKVYRLYDPSDSMNSYINFEANLFDKIKVCQNDFLTIHLGTLHFRITPTEIMICENIDTICYQEIKAVNYTTNRIVKELENGDYDVSYQLEKKYFKSKLGKIEVERKKMGCDDTGNNPFKITNKGKTLLFKDIGNLLFFECDGDHDGKTEIYLLNYFTCGGHLEIYKIDDK